MTELIRRYGYSLTEAAEHVGYQDANYVSRLFKKYYGMTVSDYRKTMEKKG
jgi:AraC-like DNA-binding protein